MNSKQSLYLNLAGLMQDIIGVTISLLVMWMIFRLQYLMLIHKLFLLLKKEMAGRQMK
jgi:hypothetical protein